LRQSAEDIRHQVQAEAQPGKEAALLAEPVAEKPERFLLIMSAEG
jgi:hypothetical protein